MHSKQIVHHDLKAKNIMLHGIDRNQNNLYEHLKCCRYKIIDFGLTKKYAHKRYGNDMWKVRETRHRAGSMPYTSPEKKRAPSYNPFLADCYALGVVLLQAAIGPDLLWRKFLAAKSMMTACDEHVQSLLRCANEQSDKPEYFAAMYMLVSEPESERSHVGQVMPYFQ